VIPTDNLRILNPPIMLEERVSLNQKGGLIGKVQELSCRSHEVVAPTPLTRIHSPPRVSLPPGSYGGFYAEQEQG